MKNIKLLALFIMLVISTQVLASNPVEAQYRYDLLPYIPAGMQRGIKDYHKSSAACLGDDLKRYSDGKPRWETTERPLTTFACLREGYGGPASIQSVLYYLTGINNSQESIARDINLTDQGSKPSNVLNYLNNNQDIATFRHLTYEDTAWLKLAIADSIVEIGVPVIVGVNFKQSEGWPYDSGKSRYVVVYGIWNDSNYVAISDPYVEFAGLRDVKRYYQVSIEALNKAYVRSGTGVIYADIPSPYGRVRFAESVNDGSCFDRD